MLQILAFCHLILLQSKEQLPKADRSLFYEMFSLSIFVQFPKWMFSLHVKGNKIFNLLKDVIKCGFQITKDTLMQCMQEIVYKKGPSG
jgi:hypothetical protein